MSVRWQQPLPPPYPQLADDELRQRIAAARRKLGSRLLILGHHYQQDPVIAFADCTGDSLELSRRAAAQKDIEYVIFCGVHFMAETADMLTSPHVQVILPDLGAGCSMADMASLEQTEECWKTLEEVCAGQRIVPITYVNSSAAIKAFVGRHGGAVCTSSNCRGVLQWALENGGARFSRADDGDAGYPLETGRVEPCASRLRTRTKVLFLPDQHLGRNTAYAMGFPLERMVVWDPRLPLGGNTPDALRQADFVLWKGHCSVHALFRPEHVDQVRRKFPGMRVIVHPECRWEVVQKADDAGSTSYIVKQVEAAGPGAQWAVGTEVNLVNRLARRHPEQRIIVLSECQCLCTTMFRIDLPHLCWAIENLAEGVVVNRITVDAETRRWALVALERMLAATATGSPLAAAPAAGR